VAPSKRERDYARRRYARWQDRRATRERFRRRRRSVLLAAVAAVAVVAVVATVGWLTRGEPEETSAGSPDAGVAETAPSGDASPPDETAAPEDAGSPCPPPPPAPSDPPQFAAPPAPAQAQEASTATIRTSCGDLAVELFPDAAPQAVASFAFLAGEEFYAGTPCHRLTTQGIFVLQCGDPTGTGQGGPGYTYGPVENAPADDVYPAGTLAMARVGGDGASMGSQFFVVHEDSTIPSDAAGGYTVFGRVTEGLDVLRTVAEAGVEGGAADGAPAAAVSLQEVVVP
jgi:peptidyl-prolyl cis-trans isomerase B (cyclophilin B)